VSTCPQPLVTHYFANSPSGKLRGRLYECSDPACTARPAEHSHQLPCRWSWPLASGKASGGQAFPRRRCPGCEHIRRAGKPDTQLVQALTRRRSA
jgi:hypothetical protein